MRINWISSDNLSGSENKCRLDLSLMNVQDASKYFETVAHRSDQGGCCDRTDSGNLREPLAILILFRRFLDDPFTYRPLDERMGSFSSLSQKEKSLLAESRSLCESVNLVAGADLNPRPSGYENVLNHTTR